MHDDANTPSTRPYLLRALHEWCSDNGLTPYLAVQVDASVQVPRAFVQDGHIVLNASYEATSALHMGNEFISFKARFGGKPHDIMVPVGRVVAIYARETGQGMSFPPEEVGEHAEHTPESVPEAVPGATNGEAAASRTSAVHLVPVPSSSEEDSQNEGDGSEPHPSPSAPAGAGGGQRPVFTRVK